MHQTLEKLFESADKATQGGLLFERKKEMLDRAVKLGLPSRKLESWKYTSPQKILTDDFSSVSVRNSDVSCDSFLQRAILDGELGILFINGRLHEESLQNIQSIPGLDVSSLSTLQDGEEVLALLPASSDYHDGLSALNEALLEEGLFLRVEAGCKVEECVHIVHYFDSLSAKQWASPKVLIHSGDNSQLCLRESFLSDSDASHVCFSSWSIFAGRNSQIDFVRLQNLNDKAKHLDDGRITLSRDSRVSINSVSLGGGLVRNSVEGVLAGEGSNLSLKGVNVANDQQHMDNQVNVIHEKPHASSSQLYKGVLKDRSRVVFNGKVLIKPKAQLTDAQQLNANLVLDDGAEVDTKPNMEIHADDVKCSHGATIGSLSPDQLFYLTSRGLSELQAKEMLSVGFAADALSGLSDAVKSSMIEHVRRRLS